MVKLVAGIKSEKASIGVHYAAPIGWNPEWITIKNEMFRFKWANDNYPISQDTNRCAAVSEKNPKGIINYYCYDKIPYICEF